MCTYECVTPEMNLCNKRNLRNLSELILKKLEQFIEFNDQRLLEVTRDMRVPKTSGTVDEDEKTKFMMRQYERGNISYCNNCGNCNNCSNSRNSKNVDNSCEDKDNKRIDEEEKQDSIESELLYDWQNFEELTEEEFNKRIINLRGYIDHNEMFVLWNYVYNKGKKKYLNLKEELWKICEKLLMQYDISEDYIMREWKKLNTYLKDELMKKQRDDFMELKMFIDSNDNLRWEYVAFIIDKNQSWDVIKHMTKDKLQNKLVESFEKYADQAQEREIEKTPKTGARSGSANNNNDEREILVSNVL
ncbi:uncharacterized protein MKS88_000053 [Plasmodium brasilianum]|nr:hypothetical protein MKS88_000053 [Plasmodium brasilianum]